MKKIIIITILILCAILAWIPNAQAGVSRKCIQYSALHKQYNSQFENQIASLLINYKRNIKEPATRRQWVENVSNHKLYTMYTNTAFDHDIAGKSWRTQQNECGLYPRAGEILGGGFSTPQELFNAWIASPSHKAVIENSHLRYFGVACADFDKNLNSNQLGHKVSGTICVISFSD